MSDVYRLGQISPEGSLLRRNAGPKIVSERIRRMSAHTNKTLSTPFSISPLSPVPTEPPPARFPTPSLSLCLSPAAGTSPPTSGRTRRVTLLSPNEQPVPAALPHLSRDGGASSFPYPTPTSAVGAAPGPRRRASVTPTPADRR